MLIGYYNVKTKNFIPIDQFERINKAKGFHRKAFDYIIELHSGPRPLTELKMSRA